VTKGSRVYAAGRCHTLGWEDAETGERHARVEIVLDDLILLDRRGGASVAPTDDPHSVPRWPEPSQHITTPTAPACCDG
jgi:single-stranded DNA-binding protein